MNKFAIMAAVAAASLLAVPGVASAQVYAGAGYTQYDFNEADAEVGGITGRVGYRFNQNLAVEGEGTFGIDDDDGAELNHALGAYAVGTLPVGSSFGVHARAGYQQFDVDTPGPDIDDGGFSYGAGLGWQATPGLGIRADFTRTEVDDEDIDAISLGGTVNF